MDNQNTVEITLPAYAQRRTETEDKAIQDLVDQIKDQHGVDVTFSPQAEYRSADLAVAIPAIEVLVGSNAYWILRPLIDELIRQGMARFQRAPTSGPVIFQQVNYINGDNNTVHNTIYNLRDGTADDEDDKSP